MRTVRRPFRRAFTLIELLITVGVVGVLMGAIGGVIVLPVRAIPANQVPTQGMQEATGVLSRLAGELRMAVRVNEGTATSVDFTVPDRTGDGSDDQIVYAWDGKDGGTITRTLNGGTPQALASGVDEFSLRYRVSSVASTTAGPWINGPESLVVTYDKPSPASYTIRSSDWIGMTITPPIPSSAFCYSVTRVGLVLKNSGVVNDGVIGVQLHSVDATGTPTSTVLGQGTINESSLGSNFGTVAVPLSGADGLSPGTRFAVIVKHQAGVDACKIGEYSVTPSGTDFQLETKDAGLTWKASNNDALCLRVYCATTTFTLSNVARNALERIDVRLRCSLPGSPESQTSIALVNAPEVQ